MSEYMDLGSPSETCQHCKSVMWKEERNNKSQKNQRCTFSICCKNGEVRLPPEKPPPPFLAALITGGKFDHYMQHIRAYNQMFAMTSTGGIVDKEINSGNAPYCYRLNGQNHHRIGSLHPNDGQTPKFCQLYIYDTENEVENRISALSNHSRHSNIDPDIVDGLLKMLDEHNKLVKRFRTARERLKDAPHDEFKLVLLSSQSASGRKNHVNPSDEVVAFIVGDGLDSGISTHRDIIIQTNQGFLKDINETFRYYMQLQYPLLFPYGDAGFDTQIPYHDPHGKNKKKEEVSYNEGVLFI